MKKKVGIMSMQRIANYGSFLQAFALKQLIEELHIGESADSYIVMKSLREDYR